MRIYTSTEKIYGNRFIGENHLPKYRDKAHNKNLIGKGLLDEEKEGYGYETGDRFLPYLLQDQLTRERKEESVKTIIMENDILKATFFPEYGMRLVSLYNKREQRELLFKNPVLQFANLAIRRAWFSGGIEWNVGQYGHSFTTCESLFVSHIKRDDEEFIRCFEFERCKKLYWYIDFHLKDGDDYLSIYAKVINPNDYPVPFYWWTNIAVPEEKGIRIFSGSPEVIYIEPLSLKAEKAQRGMGHGTLPHLDKIKPGVDFSYPENFTEYSNEYFFQNNKDLKETWEAAFYKDGNIFFDRSSEDLCYHKMFCWGNFKGGQRWKDYLSNKGEGDYLELQAGFARTQVHGFDIDRNSSLDFVQIFGSTHLNPDDRCGEWKETRDKIYSQIDSIISEKEMNFLLESYRKDSEITPTEFLHFGNGFGALEELRKPGITPKALFFPKNSIKEKEEPWLNLLINGQLPTIAVDELPESYITDLAWEPYLKKSINNNRHALNMLGVMYLENELEERAKECFIESLKLEDNAFAYRNLAIICKDRDIKEAIALLKKSCLLSPKREYIEEYIELLIKDEQHKEAWDFYSTQDKEIQEDEWIVLSIMKSAVKLNKIDFLEKQYKKEFAVIREGQRSYSDTYFDYQALLEAREKKIEVTEELIEKYRKKNEMPEDIDFRLG